MKALVRNGICRKCYKKLFNIKLRPKHFKCDYYRSICPVCGEQHHLVAEVSRLVRLRLLFKRSPELEVETKSEDNIVGEKDHSRD